MTGQDQDFLRFWTIQLHREYENICYQYGCSLLPALIRIAEVDSVWGTWNPKLRTITLARKLIFENTWDVVIEVLKHEMAHQIVNELWQDADSGHGPAFQRACQTLGVSIWARKGSGPLKHYGQKQTKSDSHPMVAKVQKLLQLALSSNEYESLQALKKARELAQKYTLNQHDFHEEPFIYLSINHFKKKISTYQSSIATILMNHFSVHIIFSNLYHQHDLCEYATMEILGERSKVEIASYVYDFLFNNLDTLWKDRLKINKIERRGKRAYCLGVLAGFANKLAEQDKLDKQEEQNKKHKANPGLLAAEVSKLANYDEKLVGFLKFRFPKLSKRSYQKENPNSETYNEGYKRGRNLTISLGVSTNSTKSQLALKGSKI